MQRRWLQNLISIRILLVFGAGAALLTMLFSTRPEDAGLKGVLLMFGLIYLFSYLLIDALARQRRRGLRNQTVIAIIASLPVVVLSLQSLGQLATRDLLITLVLLVAILFYWSRFKA